LIAHAEVATYAGSGTAGNTHSDDKYGKGHTGFPVRLYERPVVEICQPEMPALESMYFTAACISSSVSAGLPPRAGI